MLTQSYTDILSYKSIITNISTKPNCFINHFLKNYKNTLFRKAKKQVSMSSIHSK